MSQRDCYRTIVCESWEEARERLTGFDSNWVFRGQADANWALTTSLERCCRVMALSEAEPLLVRSFKRKAHLYVPPFLKPENDLEWLALMQHHGTPTALLDATWSPYIAAYFAVEAVSMRARPAIWALDSRWLKEGAVSNLSVEVREEYGIDANTDLGGSPFFDKVVLENAQPMIFPVIPCHLNERLSVQQGLFLCPGSVEASFMANLAAHDAETMHSHALKFVLPEDARPQALRDLQQMNISRTSLFPGMDGFAGSLSRSLFVLEQSSAFLADLADGLPDDFHL